MGIIIIWYNLTKRKGDKMRFFHSIIGILLIFLGSLGTAITVFDEPANTLTYNVLGVITMTFGGYYLRKYAKWGIKNKKHPL